MPSSGAVLRTLKHLRFRQIRHQIIHRLAPGRPGPALPMAWAPSRPPVPREKNTARICFDGKAGFNFNNESRSFQGDWNEASARKLWLYNLHYMAWLFDMGAAADREAWIKRWIRENPRHQMGNGWEPYPLSLRLFNWCKHFSASGSEPDAETLASMGAHAGALLGKLEFHLDGNHLLENLFAMAFAGFFLDGRDTGCRRARAKIQRLLEAELAAQFLADGGHYELSPMYHAILLERMLDLLNYWPADGDPFPGLKAKLTATALAGLDWLDMMSVAGRFSLFNDSCHDAAPEAGMLLEYGARLLGYRPHGPMPLRSLPASGYHRAECGPFTLIFDAGKLGPDHQMGHAQGDMLSFCLWMGDRPVLTHPGNFEYVSGEMRDYCRSTAAHNTLVVEGGEQAEWWSSHRVGRRGGIVGKPIVVEADGVIRMEAAHTGFRYLPGKPVHHRKLELGATFLRIEDSVEQSGGIPFRALFHFHPGFSPVSNGDRMDIRVEGGILSLESNRPLRLEDGWHCPEFGLRLRNRVAVAQSTADPIRCALFFTPILSGQGACN